MKNPIRAARLALTLGAHAPLVYLALGAEASLGAQVFATERHRLLPSSTMGRVVAADFDGDGDRDLAGGAGTELHLARNAGDGRFVLDPASPFASASVGAIAAGDIDRDGDTDLVVGQPWFFVYGPGRLFRNDGPLGLTDVSTQWATTAEASADLELFDFDRDGDLDIVTANPVNGSHQTGGPLPFNHLYLNDGTGRFTEVTQGHMPNRPYGNSCVATGDIDGDGDPDIVFGGSDCRVFVQSATGIAVETPGRVPSLGSITNGSYVDLALIDFDGDGDLDLIGASSANQGVLVFANDGLGVFSLASTINDPQVSALHAADFDRDGRTDLLAVRASSEHEPLPLRIYRNMVTGFADVTAAQLESPELAPTAVEVFDCDRDGDLDLWGALEPQPVLWHNDGRGKLLQVTLHDLSNLRLVHTALADIDGDGDQDLAGIERGVYGTSTQISVVRNAGNGIGPDRSIVVPWRTDRRSRCLEWIDADADGDLDLFVGNEGTGTSPNVRDELLRNLGGAFIDATATLLPASANAGPTTVVARGDVDRDGFDDLLTAGFASRFYRGSSAGGFVDASGLLPPSPSPVSGIALLDFDLDGDLDVAQSLGSWSASTGGFRILRNQLPAPFLDVTATLSLPRSDGWSIDSLDIDGDGRLDLLIGSGGNSGSNGLVLLRSVGQGFVDETALRVPTMAAVGSLSAVDYDGDGWLDVFPRDRWGDPLPLLRNVSGVLSVIANPWTIFPGYWPARPAAADLDADGDQDFITTFGVLRNRLRDLQNAVPPRLGSRGEMVLHAHASDGVSSQLAAVFLADALVPTPLPGLGTLWLDPSSMVLAAQVTIGPAGGESVLGYWIPPQPNLLGATLFAQALFLHSPSSATWRLGNWIRLELRV